MGRRRKRLNVISVTILFAYNRGGGGGGGWGEGGLRRSCTGTRLMRTVKRRTAEDEAQMRRTEEEKD